MIIRGKQDLAKLICKNVLLECVVLFIAFNIHDILNIILMKVKVPVRIIDSILTISNMSVGLIGFTLSCILTITSLQAFKKYRDNNGEQREQQETNLKHTIVNSRSKNIKNKQIKSNIDISGMEEIKSLVDIKRHKYKNSKR